MANELPVTRLTLPSVPEFTVWMTTDGEESPLYGIEQDKDKTICYAESRTGQPFTIHFSDDRSSRSVGFTVELHMHGQWQRARVVDFEGPHEGFLAARRDGPASERPFIFEEIKTTDDENLACTDKAVHGSLGNINVVINRWVDKTMVRKPVAARDYMYSAASDPVIHEDSKKANVSHAISYGEARSAAPTSTRSHYYNYTYVDQRGFPFHEFEFRCRSRKILEAQDLLPFRSEEIEEAESSTFEESVVQDRESSYSPSPEPRDHSESTLDTTLQTSCISSGSNSEEYEETVSEDQLINLRKKLAELELERQILAMERKIVKVSSAKHVKREIVGGKVEESGRAREVKLERQGSATGSDGIKKGKGKEVETIVLSDSD